MEFQSIQGKTLEQIQKNVNTIAMADLVDFYNEYSGQKAIKKFSDRKTAVERVDKLISDMLDKKAETASKSKGKAEVPALSAKGWEAISRIRQALAAWESDSLTVDELASEIGSPEVIVQKTVNVLERDGFLIKESKGSDELDHYSLSELGKTVKEPNRKATRKNDQSEAGTIARVRGTTGIKSKFTGMKISILPKKPPYREGSKRFSNFNLIKEGMTFEQYKEAGGDTLLLRYCDNDGFVKVQ